MKRVRERIWTTRARSARLVFARSDLQADARGRLYELVNRTVNDGGMRRVSDSNGVRRLNRQTGRQDTLASVSRMNRSPIFRPRTPKSGGDPDGPVRPVGAPPPYASVDDDDLEYLQRYSRPKKHVQVRT